MKAALFCIMMTVCQVVAATGISVKVKKLSFERYLLSTYTLSLQTIEPGESLWGCTTFTVHGSYSLWRWKIRERTRSAPTWNEHRHALQELEKIDKPFDFGTLGEGLKQTDEPCVFVSEGLVAHHSSRGLFSVISFYRNS
jgi:hypothetical protein